MATAATAKKVETATIIVFWDPDKDSLAMPAPLGAENPRPFEFSWLKHPEKIDQFRALDEKLESEGRGRKPGTLQMESLGLLKPGLNFLKADLWEKALVESQKIADTLSLKTSEMARLIDDEAFQVFKPATPERGDHILGYGAKDAAAIVKIAKNGELLEDWLKDDAVRGDKILRTQLEGRIEILKSRPATRKI